MAAGAIITALSSIPWGTVAENAPKLADGAAKLWDSVTKWNKSKADQEEKIIESTQESTLNIESLLTRLEATENSLQKLDEQMQISSALIKELAEQNSQLIQRIEFNRVNLIRVAAITGFLSISLLAIIFYLILVK